MWPVYDTIALSQERPDLAAEQRLAETEAALWALLKEAVRRFPESLWDRGFESAVDVAKRVLAKPVSE